MLPEPVAERWDSLFPHWFHHGLQETLSASMPSMLPDLSYVHAIPVWTVGPIWTARVASKPDSVRTIYGQVQEEPDWLEWLATPFARWHWREGQLYLRQLAVQTIACRVDPPWAYPIGSTPLRMDCPLYLTDGSRYEILSHERIVSDQNGSMVRVFSIDSSMNMLVGTPTYPGLADEKIIVDGKPVTAEVEFSRTERSRRAELIISRALKPQDSELYAIKLARMAGAERIWSPFYPIGVTEWDGVSDLDLPEGTTQVEVQTVPRTVLARIALQRHSESLYRSNYNLKYGVYYASSVLPATGNYVQLPAQAGEVYAMALVPLWDVECRGVYITKLKSTGNLVPGKYVVFYSNMDIRPQHEALGLWDTVYDLYNYYPNGLVIKGRVYIDGRTRAVATATIYNPRRGLGFAQVGGRTSIQIHYVVTGQRAAGASVSGRTTVQASAQVTAIREAGAEVRGSTTVNIRWVHTVPVSLQTVRGSTQVRVYPGIYLVASGRTQVHLVPRRVATSSCQAQGGTSTVASAVVMRNTNAVVTGSTSVQVTGTAYRAGQITVPGGTTASASAMLIRNRGGTATGYTVVDIDSVRVRNAQASIVGGSVASAAWLRVAENRITVSGSTSVQVMGLKGQLKSGQAVAAGSTAVQVSSARVRRARAVVLGSSNAAAAASVSQAGMVVCAGSSSVAVSAVRVRLAAASVVCGSRIDTTVWRVRSGHAQVSAGSSVQVTGQKSAPVELTASGGTTLSVTALRIVRGAAYVDGSTRVVEQDAAGYSVPSTVQRYHAGMFGENGTEPTDTESINILNAEAQGSTMQQKLIGWQYNNIRLYVWGGKRVIQYRTNNYLSGEEQ